MIDDDHHSQHSYDSSDLFLGNCVHELHHAEILKLRDFLKIFLWFLSGALLLATNLLVFWHLFYSIIVRFTLPMN